MSSNSNLRCKPPQLSSIWKMKRTYIVKAGKDLTELQLSYVAGRSSQSCAATRTWSTVQQNISLPVSLPLVMACSQCLVLLLMGAFLTGQVAQLSCTLIPQHASIADYGVSWYQQRAGSAPRYLLYYNSEEDFHRPDDIPDRFSAAKDAAHNACILTISPVQPEDDADYYCSVGYSSDPQG
ncbi:pre-B lymphocyte protein 3 isoform X2 [Cavia porcellus]|uniref:pre-B lymphocyte protein 3 isoform X2 n=1 Tax=Cavia porcellus TaxID=10141 RepID=UPI002FE14993